MATEGYPTVMVVEDDLDLRTIYTDLLTHNGFEVLSFGDGREALEALKGGQATPRLIVLDYMLSNNMNGTLFMQELSDLPNIEKIPVILVSALSSETREIAQLKSHPWVASFFSKADMAQNKLVDFIKAYFGLT